MPASEWLVVCRRLYVSGTSRRQAGLRGRKSIIEATTVDGHCLPDAISVNFEMDGCGLL